jgi:hypothetical protein
MKIRTVLIIAGGMICGLSALANGPMPSDSGTSSNSGGQMNPERERWTRHRIEELKHERQRQDAELKSIERYQALNAPYNFLNGGNPLEVTEGDRRHDAIMRQREINTIEFLAIKKERGELTPAGQRKFNALIRRMREGR